MHARTAASIVLLAIGCGDPPADDSVGADDSSTTLDDTGVLACDDAVTWDYWAAGFFLNWCTSCHSSDLPEEKRQKAPLGMNFDSYAGVAEHAVAIEYRAVTAEAKFLMPPIGGPSDTEREILQMWIECGLKEH